MTYGVGYSICKNQCKNSKPRVIIQDKQPKYWMGFQLRLIQNYHYANGTNLRRCKNYSFTSNSLYIFKKAKANLHSMLPNNNYLLGNLPPSKEDKSKMDILMNLAVCAYVVDITNNIQPSH